MLPKLREEFSKEIQSNLKLIEKQEIQGKEIESFYVKFLKTKYGDQWIDNNYKIFFNDKFFVENIMKNLGYKKTIEYSEKKEYYLKKKKPGF